MISLLGDHLSAVILVVLEVTLLVVALLVAPRDRLPSSALAWILVIVAVPILGLLLFALIGHFKLPRMRRDRQRSMSDRIEELVRVVEHPIPGPDIPAWLTPIVGLNRAVGAFPLLDGNRARILPHFPEQMAELTAAVDRAQRTVHAEFYIVALDGATEPFFQALERAVSRGVTVRVLVDHLGSRR
jgi:cardiolipin synthase